MQPKTVDFKSGELSSESDLVLAIESERGAGELWASSWSRAALLSESKAAQAIVARREQTELGFVFLREPGALWEITLIYVAPEVRGTGVFEGLIEAAKRIASHDQGSQRLGLEVRADNLRALKAYARVGFQEVSRRRGYYRDGCDAILLEIAL